VKWWVLSEVIYLNFHVLLEGHYDHVIDESIDLGFWFALFSWSSWNWFFASLDHDFEGLNFSGVQVTFKGVSCFFVDA